MRFFLFFVITSLMVALFYACASQKPPSGGPGDKTGPILIGQYPQSGTVNYTKGEVSFFFNEFINRSTVIKALKIEPDLGIKTSIKQGRKSFTVLFEEQLPPNTTVIVQLGSELTDTFNNKLGSPSTIAFSTGDKIDKGALAGAIYSAESGKGEAGLKVLLFQDEAVIGENPAKYIAETDTSGLFQFDYLAEGLYKALWVDDANRNRNLESNREYYSTFSFENVSIKTDSIAILPPLYITKEDTVAPILYETGLLTQQRLNLMFSEDVYFDETTKIQIEDSSGKVEQALPLYTVADAKQTLIAHVQKPLDNEQMKYRVNISNIKDEANNNTSISGNWFDGSTQKDTVQQRIIAYGIKNEYFYDEPIKFRYAKPFINTALKDSFFVNAQSEVFKPWIKTSLIGNELVAFPDSLWNLEGLTFNLWDPFGLSYAAYNPIIWTENKLGSIKLRFANTSIQPDSLKGSVIDSTIKDRNFKSYQIRIYDDQMKLYKSALYIDSLNLATDDGFIIDRLPSKSLNLVVFEDSNENGMYDLGKTSPFQAPEPFFIYTKADVRAGFETTIEVDFSKGFEKLVSKVQALQQGSSNIKTEKQEAELNLDNKSLDN